MPAPHRKITSNKNTQDDFPVLAFIDIETTGSNFERDRITEIGIKTLVNHEVTEWESLLDPETFISQNIQRLMGISPTMVAGSGWNEKGVRFAICKFSDDWREKKDSAWERGH